MKPIRELSIGDASHIRYVLFDIDDTITTEGKLTAQAYQSLWDLSDAGFKVIPITGRPAGWCDLIRPPMAGRRSRRREWRAGVLGRGGRP